MSLLLHESILGSYTAFLSCLRAFYVMIEIHSGGLTSLLKGGITKRKLFSIVLRNLPKVTIATNHSDESETFQTSRTFELL